MLTTVAEDGENLDGAILGRRGGVLDRHRADRRLLETRAEIVSIACRVPNLEERHSRDAHKPTLNAARPEIYLGASPEAN